MAMALALFKRYWPVMLFALAFWLWGNHQHAAGYDKRNNEAVAAELIVSKAHIRQLGQVRATEAAQRKRADDAESEALLARGYADTYYDNWKEAKKNVPLTVPSAHCPDAPQPEFTVGFAGLFNLAVKYGGPQPGVDVPAISRAADPDGRLAGADIAAPAFVTADDVLSAVGANAKLLRTCLSDRKQLQQVLEPLYEDGILLR